MFFGVVGSSSRAHRCFAYAHWGLSRDMRHRIGFPSVGWGPDGLFRLLRNRRMRPCPRDRRSWGSGLFLF